MGVLLRHTLEQGGDSPSGCPAPSNDRARFDSALRGERKEQEVNLATPHYSFISYRKLTKPMSAKKKKKK